MPSDTARAGPPERTVAVDAAGTPEERPVGVAIATPYLPELESLRGIAMLLVFAFHLDSLVWSWGLRRSGLWVPLPLAFVRAGYSGVSLFFVLSAFLLSIPFLIEGAGGKHVSVRRYAGRRALRILPLYYAAVVVGTVLTASHWHDLLRGLPYLAFLNGFGLTTQMPPYSNVWWSLATEAQFYLLLPLLPLALRSARGRRLGLLMLALWAATYAAFLTRYLRPGSIKVMLLLELSVLGNAPLFLAGIAAAWLYLHYGTALRARLAGASWLRNGGADVALLAVLVGLGLLLRWATFMGTPALGGVPYHGWHVLEALLWTSLLLLLLLAPLRSKPLFVNPVLNRLGILSYSIYVLHLPITSTILDWLRGAGYSGMLGWTPRSALAAVLITLACLGVAELTYRGIERPFLRRKERLRA